MLMWHHVGGYPLHPICHSVSQNGWPPPPYTRDVIYECSLMAAELSPQCNVTPVRSWVDNSPVDVLALY